jgi:hypothetical protein
VALQESLNSPATSRWTVTPGGAYASKSGKATLTDTTTGAVLTCTSSAADGALKSGSGLTNPLGTVTKATFSNCTGPAGLTFKIKTSALPWDVNGATYRSAILSGAAREQLRAVVLAGMTTWASRADEPAHAANVARQAHGGTSTVVIQPGNRLGRGSRRHPVRASPHPDDLWQSRNSAAAS